MHRDIKPENVLVVSDERGTTAVRLTDFGIAWMDEAETLTRITDLLGTPAYLAPEMAEQTQADAAVDLYAFGVLLYEAIVGQTPFAGDNVMAMLRRHISEVPERPDRVPEPLWALLAALLAKDPRERPTAEATAAWLRRLQTELTGRIPAQPLPTGGVDPTADTLPLPGGAHEDLPVDGTLVTSRSRTPAPAREPEPAASPWYRRPLVVGPALTALLGLIAAAALVLPSDPAPVVVAAEPVAQELTLAPVAYRDGLVVTRRWTLDPAGETLHVELGLHNGGGRPLLGRLTERLPDVFSGRLADAVFTPAPTERPRPDIVYYDLDRLQPRRYVPVAYDVPAPETGDLKSWARDFQKLRDSGTQPPAPLDRLELPVEEMSLDDSTALQLPVAGTLRTGAPASAVVLRGVTWRSSDPDVATVEAGRVVAVRKGTTTITAVAGGASEQVRVDVVGVGERSSTRPRRPPPPRRPPRSRRRRSSARARRPRPW